MKSILRYLKILKSIAKTSIIADMEFRLNFAIKIFNDFIWYFAQLSIFKVLFTHSKNISGWTYESTQVFMTILFMSDAIYMTFFHENLDKLSDRVRKGDLDLILAKPMNSQFALSFYKINPTYLLNVILTICWFVYAVMNLPYQIPIYKLLLLLILVPCSSVLTYSMRFIFCTLSVIFVRAENIMYLWYQIYRLGTRPDTIYPNFIRYSILFVFPLAMIASIPARVVLFDESLLWIVWMILLSGFFLFLSNRFWNYALKKYSSASS